MLSPIPSSVSGKYTVSNTPSGVPILELFDKALSYKAGAIVLCPLIVMTGCGCLIVSHTWQARLCVLCLRQRFAQLQVFESGTAAPPYANLGARKQLHYRQHRQ